MKPESVGRVLGIGLRVAGRVAGQHLANTPSASANASEASAVTQSQPNHIGTRRQAAGQTTRNIGHGLSGFLKPFRTVGGKIWLEVVGAFFLLPVLAFAPVLWRTRTSWQHGSDHRTFLAAAVIVVIFLYLGVSSFWRAGRRR